MSIKIQRTYMLIFNTDVYVSANVYIISKFDISKLCFSSYYHFMQ